MDPYVASTTDTIVSGYLAVFNDMITYVTENLLLTVAGIAILIFVVNLVKKLFWSPFGR